MYNPPPVGCSQLARSHAVKAERLRETSTKPCDVSGLWTCSELWLTDADRDVACTRSAPVTGANASRIGGDSAPPTEREGPPKEGRWKHDGGADFSSSWQGGGRERGGERLQGRLGPLREDRPRIVQSVVSAVSKPDEDEGGKSKEGDKEERPASGRKRGGEERDEDNKRHFSDERPAKAMVKLLFIPLVCD